MIYIRWVGHLLFLSATATARVNTYSNAPAPRSTTIHIHHHDPPPPPRSTTTTTLQVGARHFSAIDDVVTPGRTAAFGWDIPCPPPARRSELLALKLALAPSTQETHTLSAALAQQMRGEVRLALERIDASAWLGSVRFTSPHGGNPITIG